MTYRAPIFIVSFLVLLGCIVGCTHNRDERLRHIASIVSDSPHEALSLLDSIDSKSLDKEDKYFYDFLTIKARDKAYIRHTDDSLYLHVLDYYSLHKRDTLYPEVLYYGGRVYSDLGDYPTSLQYFQKALDLLPSNTKLLNLKNRALSQTGRLLSHLRLYDKAVPYLEQAIRMDSIINDSLSIMFDKQLLGTINLYLKNYSIAEKNFKESRSLAEKISPIDITQLNVYLAAIQSKTNHHDSAIKIIRTIFEKGDIEDRDNALVYATEIYYRAQIYDTAFIYAHELIHDKSKNLRFALHLVLTPNLIKFVPSDSLLYYISEYQDVTENTLNQNTINEALLQSSYYNYQIHDREREKTEREKAKIKNILIGVIFVVLLLSIFVLYLKNRNNRSRLQLHEALDKLNLIRKALDSEKSSISKSPITFETDKDCSETELSAKDNDKQKGTNRIRAEYIALQLRSDFTQAVDPGILSSEAYSSLQSIIREQKIMSDTNPLWSELESVILAVSTNFKKHLQLLAEGNLEADDYNLAILIKCGITSTQISRLIGRSRSGVSYRRDKLSLKLFGQKLESDVLDNIIRSL